jgi:signal transduction histidine kinase
MIGGGRPRLHGSVFVKLVAIMIAMAASLLAMVGGFFWFIVSPNLTSIVIRVGEEHARAIASTMPNLETARRLGERHDIQVRYEGPDGIWTTDEELPTVAEVRSDAGSWRRFLRGRAYYVAPGPGGGTYLISSSLGRRIHDAHLALVGLLLLLMIAVVVTTHLVLRRLLAPLRSLGDGVARLSAGELDLVLPNRTRDEFGALTEAFNQMVGRVREMIRARDRLLLDVSHELRSPLTRLKVALELLPASERRTRMMADVGEMEAMIAELLELERLRDGSGLRPERQDVVSILREVADSLREKPPGVQLAVPARAVVAEVDGGKLRTVLRNLVENAAKYSLPDSRPIELSASSHDGAVIIRVCDDGPGIPEGDEASLFEPFFRVDRSRSKRTGGYGLGLSICKRIMEAHGGAIAVERHAGRGATFVLTLPADA